MLSQKTAGQGAASLLADLAAPDADVLQPYGRAAPRSGAIADGSVLAIPELERYTAPLRKNRLIVLTDEIKWQITQVGEAMLEQRHHRLH
jgi:hypothetical protein